MTAAGFGSCAGRNHFIGGKLVPSSIDAYLVMEFADGGDLFGLRGQLAATEVGARRCVPSPDCFAEHTAHAPCSSATSA